MIALISNAKESEIYTDRKENGHRWSCTGRILKEEEFEFEARWSYIVRLSK